MRVEKKNKSSQIIKRLFKDHIKPYKGKILLAIFYMVIVAACTAAIVRLVQPAIDEVFVTNNRKMLLVLPFIMCLIYSLKGIAEYYQNYIIKYVGQQILTNLQVQMYEHLLLADLAFIQSQSSGRLISKFTNDISLMRAAVSNMLVGCAKYLLSILFLIIIMFSLEPTLSAFVFLAFPLAIYPIQKIGRNMRKVCEEAQEELSNYTARLDETFHSIKIIKSFSGEKIEAQRAREISRKILAFYKRASKFDALTSPIMEILTGLTIACMLWYGGIMVIEKETTLGALMAFITAFVSAYRPFKSLVSLNVHLQEGLAAASRVFNLLDIQPQIKDTLNAEKPILKSPVITFHNVALSFGQKVAIKQVDLKLAKDKTYAFVGRSGSGKTSLANLLVRFYDPTAGRIMLDNYDIKDIAVSHLRQHISLVTQDTILFDASVAENISYGRPNSSREDIIKAAKAADAHEFIQSLPEGYDTVIGFGGLTLSGGQRQRLSIARAFIKNAPILILDEATSSLDSNSEQAIITALSRLKESRTTLIITHRLTSITDADQIIVMKLGHIVEQGTHTELLQNQKEYCRLYNKQLKEIKENV